MKRSNEKANLAKSIAGPGFVADGEMRFFGSRWYQEKRTAIVKEIRARHAAELATAPDSQKVAIEETIRQEAEAELRKLDPSPHALW